MKFQWAERLTGMENPTVKNLLKTMQKADLIAFSAGSPASGSFPVRELQTAFSAVLAEQGAEALQYGVSEGFRPLREWVAERVKRFGVWSTADQVLIANGSQQVLDFIARILIDPGDYVAVENPTYLAALQVFKGYQARLLPIPLDENGMQVEQLEAVIQKNRPKLIYVNPTFQNPTGLSMSLARRKSLGEIAAHYQIPVIEDNPYGELRYEGADIPAIKGITDNPWLLYAGTASKVIAPGLRLGWLIADPEFIDKIATAKQLNDVLSNSLTQRAVYRYVTDNDLDVHIQTVRDKYRVQRDVMAQAMERYFPAGISWIVPAGGMFIWVTLPQDIDANALLPLAIEEAKVAYVPGTPFFADNRGQNTMRLNFSNSDPDVIETGILRLGNLLKRYM